MSGISMNIETIAGIKGAARRSASLHRAQAARDAGPSAADRVAAEFFALTGEVAGKVVSAYWPIKDEIGTSVLMHRAIAKGAEIVLPVVQGAGKPLLFREWTPTTALEKGSYGAMIPPADSPVFEPDILILPLLAFDTRGYRLGYGGGYYDRTLAALRAKKTVLAIGIAYAGQETHDVPHEATDQKIDAIVTEVEGRWLTARPEPAS